MEEQPFGGERNRLQRGNRGELRVVSGIVKQEKLLAALLGDHLRNDGMIERFCGILRGYGARLIAISEEILARLLVADDADLQNTFPLLKFVKGESPQEFECVCHSHKFEIRQYAGIIYYPQRIAGVAPQSRKAGGGIRGISCARTSAGSCKKILWRKFFG